ncbi:GntR family transcriptional regulator [Acuticoccus mangrovi]|uniref:GntR family transcriptional regulator n=1 Tax=Acuticoccus mangrovi TaxID=2796142 RepID=A0A934MGV9_9HYPH|nr:GntR family transcriptional regulator [Acuticoccus mangrovi]MBJ3777013.1 GntR family transcriptional regulator [Acuticoccus mangrovi]
MTGDQVAGSKSGSRKQAGGGGHKARWEQIYLELKKRIISCELPPGSAVSEAGLAREYDVSPTPVRDALSRLRQEGLVSPSNGRSYHVTPINLADLRDLSEARFVLESGIVRMIVENADDAAIASLEAYAVVPDGHLKGGPERIAINRAFHLAVAKITHNTRLVAMLTRILDESERLFNFGIVAWPATELESTHLDLVKALEARDCDRAVQLCRQETDETTRRILDSLMRDPERAKLVGFGASK